ncbi:MAG: hypothetical protein RLZZ429_1520 [Bacteroidota bacterium]|jgi:bacteriocin-like protein
MKQSIISQVSTEVQELSLDEMNQIEGGNFVWDFFYVAGATLRCIREFTKAAAEYQSSLPHYLKK